LEDYICSPKFPCIICKYEHQTNSWVFLVSSNLWIQSFYEQISNWWVKPSLGSLANLVITFDPTGK
jgi:hypothetical protein